jgi:signal transduction histidine kinase
MKRRLFISIRTKLTIAFFIVFLIPMAAVFWVLSQRVQESFDRLSRPRMNNARIAIASDFGNTVDAARLQTLTLAQNGRLSELVYLCAQTGYTHELNPVIHELNALGETTSLSFIRLAGPDQVLAAYPDRTIFLQPLAPEFASRVGDAFHGRAVATISHVKVEEGAGLAVVVFAPVRYQSDFDNLDEAPVDAVLITGTFLDQAWLANLHDLSTAQILFYSGRKFTAAEPAAAAAPPLGDAFLNALDTDPQHTAVRNMGGAEYLFGGLPVSAPDTGEVQGYLVIGVSREEMHAVMADMRDNALKVVLMGAGLCLVLAFGISMGITRPIAALGRSARLIGGGRFREAHNNVRSRDEVGLLGGAMNIMIDGLENYSEKLAMSERVAAWREIARRIAHEIKNPLSPIQLSVENMKALYEQDPAEFKQIFPEASDTVLEEVDKLRRLANEFSEFARMPKPEFESVDLAEVIGNVVNLHARSAGNVNVSFTADQPGMLVRADRDQLNRVFTNLVKNAIEAMPAAGDLSVLLRRVNDEVFVVVEDTGEGMDTDQLARIFTPYYTTKPRGSGLGLAIVQRILQDHGATFDVYSEKGKGTKFIIAFKEMNRDKPPQGGPSHA